MALRVELAHHSRNRVRLRIREKRKDTHYFMSLYEELRAIEDVSDIEINPMTGSVLLRYPDGAHRRVFGSLIQLGLLSTEPLTSGHSRLLNRVEGFLGEGGESVASVRTVLFALMVAITAHQLLRGKLLIPALTLALYAYEILASHRKEQMSA